MFLTWLEDYSHLACWRKQETLPSANKAIMPQQNISAVWWWQELSYQLSLEALKSVSTLLCYVILKIMLIWPDFFSSTRSCTYWGKYISRLRTAWQWEPAWPAAVTNIQCRLQAGVNFATRLSDLATQPHVVGCLQDRNAQLCDPYSGAGGAHVTLHQCSFHHKINTATAACQRHSNIQRQGF